MNVGEINFELVSAIKSRRIDAYRLASENGDYAESRNYLAEATSAEDVDFLARTVHEMDPDLKKLVKLYAEVWQEFTLGLRCAVCGLTAKQAKDQDYDCVKEC